MSYIPLWCKSNGSFLEGASHPEELVEHAHALGLPAIAITDHDGVYGIVRAHVKAKELGIALIVGAEVTVRLRSGGAGSEPGREADSSIVLLAQNRQGYASLCRLISTGRLRAPKGEIDLKWDDVYAHAGGLLALWGGDRSLIAGEDVAQAREVGRQLKDAFGDRLYAMAARHRRDTEIPEELRLRALASELAIPIAAAVEVLYHSPSRRMLQDVLTCIRHGTTIHTAGRTLKPNGEHALRSAASFAALFEDDPSAIARTHEIAARCTFSMSDIRYRYPAEPHPDGLTPSEWLRSLTITGAHKRFGTQIPPAVLF